MEIRQLQYFIGIVEANFNISAASKKLLVSQPALSQMIKSFEEKEGIVLFERSHGRLIRLTRSGENFYQGAKEVVQTYENMMSQLRADSTVLKGKIRIGIPQLVISMVFSNFLSGIIINNPDIKFEIVEAGANELRKSYILEEFDIVVLLRPANLPAGAHEEIFCTRDELCLFVGENHPYFHSDQIKWKDLDNQKLATFTESFMIHSKLTEKFKQMGVNPDITLKSPSWDFLLHSAKESQLLTILPAPSLNYYGDKGIKRVAIEDPVHWEVAAYRPKKPHYTVVEDFVFHEIRNYFTKENYDSHKKAFQEEEDLS